MGMDDQQFSLTHSDQLSDEKFSVYAILIFPPDSIPQTVAILPVNRETLDINVVNVWGDMMPIGARALAEVNEENEEGISPESIRDAVVPRILILLSMTITGYNFLDPQAQKITEMEEKLDVSTDELPEGPSFDYDSPEDLFKALGE
jgi:hypothetical protein